jgi:predicted ATPase
MAKNQPAAKFRLGYVTATVWKNDGLAQLWRDEGKLTEARDLLAPIYGWFSEGFDTPDLKEAKTLLDELVV